MPANIPSEAEVLDNLSNWGRWGDDDHLGILNLLSAAKTRQATTLAQEGVIVSCSRTVGWTPEADHMAAPLHFMSEAAKAGQAAIRQQRAPARQPPTFSEWRSTATISLTSTASPTSFGRAKCTTDARRT